jgi:hypothetical protein
MERIGFEYCDNAPRSWISSGVTVAGNARCGERIEGLFHLLRCFWLLLPNTVLALGISSPSNRIWCDRMWRTGTRR